MTRFASVRRLGLLLSLGTSQGAWAEPASTGHDPAVQATMRQVGTAAKQLIPFVFEQKSLRDPINHQALIDNLAAIDTASSAIRAHATRLGEDFEVNGSAIARDVAEATRAYERKAYDETLYRLHNVLDSCVNCHSGNKSSAAPSFDISSDLNLAALDSLQRARLFTASRRFDEALKAYEDILNAQDFRWYELSHDSTLLDYLILGIRVTGNYARTQKTLERIAAKPEVPAYLAIYLKSWIAGTTTLVNDPDLSKPTMRTARRLMQMAKGVMDYQADRTGLVYMLQAGGLLRKVVADPKTPPADRSEAYLILGMIEIIGGRTFWISQAADYFEAAIRANPGSDSASKAYAYLEEHLIVFAFTVNSERLPPADLTARLKELQPLSIKRP